jgi:hypothetical protein
MRDILAGLQFMRDILARLLSWTETDWILLSAVPVYRLSPSFPVYFYEEESRVYIIFA